MTLGRFLVYLRQFLFQPQHLIPLVAKLLFLSLLAIYPLALLHRAWNLKPLAAVWCVVVGLLLAGGFLVLPWLLGILRTPNSYRYNGIVSLALVYAGFALIALECAPRRWTLGLEKVVALALMLVFVFQHNAASFVTYNLNRRDWSIAERMIERIERLEPLSSAVSNGLNVVRVVVVGKLPLGNERPFGMPETPAPMMRSIIQCGAFDCQTQQIPHLFNLLKSLPIIYKMAAKGLKARVFSHPEYDLEMMRP